MKREMKKTKEKKKRRKKENNKAVEGDYSRRKENKNNR